MYDNYKITKIRSSSNGYKKYEFYSRFVKKFHYSKSMPRGCAQRYALFINNKLAGILLFGTPTGKRAMAKYGDNVLELKRVVLSPRCVKNTASWFIARGIKKLKEDRPDVDKILTYADQNQGHEGIIYKASNFQYLGESKPQQYGYIKHSKVKLHLRNMYQKDRSGNLTKTAKMWKLLHSQGKAVFKYAKPKHIFIYNLRSR